MQTGSRVGQPQMGPSDTRRRRIYSLSFPFLEKVLALVGADYFFFAA